MRLASRRGSTVLLSALRFLTNVVFQNDAAKAAFVAGNASLALGATSATVDDALDRPSVLFALLDRLVIDREREPTAATATRTARGAAARTHAALVSSANAVLKALVVHSECLLYAIKSGFVTRLLTDVQRRLRRVSQASKSDPVELSTLCDLLGVLAGVASLDDGRQAVYANTETSLGFIVDDILQSSDAHAEVLRHGSLFVRNLSLSRLSRSYSAVWEAALDLVLKRLLQALVLAHERERNNSGSEQERRHDSSDSGASCADADVAQYLSCALWSIVFEHQKARTLLLSRPSVVRQLEQALMVLQSAVARPGTRERQESDVVLCVGDICSCAYRVGVGRNDSVWMWCRG